MKRIATIFTIMLLAVTAVRGSTAEPQLHDTIYVDACRTMPKGGKLMLIPDSLVGGVESVLRGYSNIVRDNTKLDPDDRIIILGDTVPPVIKDRNIGRYNRGLYNFVYIPKGSWQVGVTASYGEFSSDSFELLDIISDLDFSISTFSVKPYMSYFVGSNKSVGLRFGYSGAKGKLDSANVDFDEDLSFNLAGVSYRNESYSAAFFFRQYIGLSRAGRFGVFNEAELAFSSGNSTFRRMYNDAPRTTSTVYTDIHLNFSPGLSVFIMDNVSFNISFGVFGLYLHNERQRTVSELLDEPETGNRFTSGANFRFNIFNINFGLGIHF